MQFIFFRNFRRNLFGKPEGSQTLAGDSENSKIDIETLLKEIVSIKYPKLSDKKMIKNEKEKVLKQISKIELNKGISIKNDNGEIVALIGRVSDEVNMGDLIGKVLD